MKRLINIILSLVLAVSSMSFPVFALENDNTSKNDIEVQNKKIAYDDEDEDIDDDEDDEDEDMEDDEDEDIDDDAEQVEGIDLSSVNIGDKFKKKNSSKVYEVVELDTDNIYLHGLPGDEDEDGDEISDELNIDHFEVRFEEHGEETWRKFVNLEQLCKKTDICEKESYSSKKYGKEISIWRKYENSITDYVEGKGIERAVYYTTNHRIGTDKFSSALFIDEGYGTTPSEAAKNKDNEGAIGNFYIFGDTDDDDVETEKFDSVGESTLVDVESLIDENDNIYISLRFLSEALGARVDWIQSEDEDEPDNVLIRFYDSDNYCKNLDIEFAETNMSSEEMYEHILEKANKGENYSTSLDIEYEYWNDDNDELDDGTAKWKNIYLSGNAVKFDEKMIDGTTSESKLIEWFADEEDKNDPLIKRIHFYGETKSREGETSRFLEACPENVEDGELTSLEGCVDITGIIMYYGVPIPIQLLTKEEKKCELDTDSFEK